jgi:hypothetical protein
MERQAFDFFLVIHEPAIVPGYEILWNLQPLNESPIQYRRRIWNIDIALHLRNFPHDADGP